MKYERKHDIDGQTYTDEEAWEIYLNLKQTFEPVDIQPIHLHPLFPNGLQPATCQPQNPYGFTMSN